MASSDRVIGAGILILSGVIFLYYSTWVLVLPFMAPNHPVHSLFLPQVYAISIPTTIFVLLLSVVGVYVGYVFVTEVGKRKKR